MQRVRNTRLTSTHLCRQTFDQATGWSLARAAARVGAPAASSGVALGGGSRAGGGGEGHRGGV